MERKSIDDVMWDLLEKVIEKRITVERARYILAGSGRLDMFDEHLEILTEDGDTK